MKTYKKAIFVYDEKISEYDVKIIDVEIVNNCASKILTMVVDGIFTTSSSLTKRSRRHCHDVSRQLD